MVLSEPNDATVNTTVNKLETPQYFINLAFNFGSNNVQSGFTGNAAKQNAFVVSPCRADPTLPYAAPRLSLGDLNGDGQTDLIIANGPNSRSTVTVVDGKRLFTGSNDLATFSLEQ